MRGGFLTEFLQPGDQFEIRAKRALTIGLAD
jgi:hypothetical protein